MTSILKDNWHVVILITMVLPVFGLIAFILTRPEYRNVDSPVVAVQKFCASQHITPENIYCTDAIQSYQYQQCTMTFDDHSDHQHRLDLLCPNVGANRIGCVRYLNDK